MYGVEAEKSKNEKSNETGSTKDASTTEASSNTNEIKESISRKMSKKSFSRASTLKSNDMKGLNSGNDHADSVALDMHAPTVPEIENFRASTLPVRQLRPNGLANEFIKAQLPTATHAVRTKPRRPSQQAGTLATASSSVTTSASSDASSHSDNASASNPIKDTILPKIEESNPTNETSSQADKDDKVALA